MATQPTYCTERDLKDVFPEVDSFDSKTPIYGWVQLFSHGGFKLYEAFNTGLTTVLFQNGEDLTPCQQVESYSDSTANTNEAVDIIETEIDTTDGTVFGYGDIIKIDDEKMLVTNISADKLTVKRGFLGTSNATHTTATDIEIGVEWSEAKQWLYSGGNDSVLLYEANSTDPNDLLVESGEDFSTLKTRYMQNASEYLDSRLDGTLPRRRFKDQDGNYDYIIVRTAALLSAVFLIRSHDPTSEVASALFDEATDAIDRINNGQTKLSWQITQDDSQGTVKEVAVSGNLRIVDTRGHYTGVYDRIKVKVIAGGAIGKATYSVWIAGNDKLGIHEGSQVVTAEKINGDYQNLASGLQIRFAGDKLDTATADDEWEIEVHGRYEEVDNPTAKSIKMTRRGLNRTPRWL